MSNKSDIWPELDFAAWRDTAITLQLWMQIVGKIRLALTPWVNHGWQVPLYVTSRGLGTSPIPWDGEIFDIEFDFLAHRLNLQTSLGEQRWLPLKPQTVADFNHALMELLRQLHINVRIHEMPNEIANPVSFPEDRIHAAYDAAAAHRFWRALVQADRVLKTFRSAFLGKVSPVHFFWGGFDLAVTRFSGRRAPLHPGGIPGLPDAVTREAYSHEVSSAGFWPGNDAFPEAAFYSYAYPEPDRYAGSAVSPGARYDKNLREFILPYDAVRSADDPDALLLDFLFSTYESAATHASWDRTALECDIGRPGRVRAI